jgi:hypothetical protein
LVAYKGFRDGTIPTLAWEVPFKIRALCGICS